MFPRAVSSPSIRVGLVG